MQKGDSLLSDKADRVLLEEERFVKRLGGERLSHVTFEGRALRSGEGTG